MEINGSFLKSKNNQVKTIEELNKSSISGIHIDFMDNTWVKNNSLRIEDMALEEVKKPIEVHMMVSDPLKYLDDFKEKRIDHYIFHIEAVNNPLEVILEIIRRGIRPGIAINPLTSVELLRPYLKYVDMVLLMSVTPGEGGQPFLENTTKRLMALRRMYKGKIEVDGGINPQTIKRVRLSDAVVCGSYICMSDNYEARIQELKKALETK